MSSATKAALERARRTSAVAKQDANEMMSMAATSYFLGSAVKSGSIEKIPEIFGMPRTVTVAIAAKLLAYNASGTMKQVANGAANACAAVAIYQFANGQEVAGGLVAGNRSLAQEQSLAKRLKAKVRESLEENEDVQEALEDLAG